MTTSILFTSCSTEPQFAIVCGKIGDSSYILKWEIFSDNKDQEVSIYMSDNDSVFNEPPLKVVNVNDCFTRIDLDNASGRKFFRLKLNNVFSHVVSHHSQRMDSIQNLRDLGGYFTVDGSQIRWGKLYRSGELTDVSDKDYKTLGMLGLKSLIDFRDDKERALYPNKYNFDRIFSVPIVTNSRDYVTEKIIDGSFAREDVISFTRKVYKSVIEENEDSFVELFNILCDESNYPVVLESYLGKDRVGLASYLVLRSLGVYEDSADEDYLKSNSYVNGQYTMGDARFLPENMQEAVTVVCKVDLSYLDIAKAYMVEKSGSVDNYIRNELKLTDEKKEKLKEILLYR